MIPHRGICVLTQVGQGLQNSDHELEQLLCQILGNELTSDQVIISRDEGIIGGSTVTDLIDSWERILGKLKANNM